mgnify:FL=1
MLFRSPGETEEDFQETLRVVREARFAIAYTFQYSKRPGTPAAELPDQLPKSVVQDRYERLLEVVNQIAWEENQKQIGKTVEVLIGNSEGRKDEQTNRLTGRSKDNRLVHIDWAGEVLPRPGDLVEVEVLDAKPYFLIATAGTEPKVRRTIAGDAFERAELASCATPVSATGVAGSVSLSVSVKSNN